MEETLTGQTELSSQIQSQGQSLEEISLSTQTTFLQLHDQHEVIQEVKTITSKVAKRTKSLLTVATDTLSQATLGLLTLRDIAVKIANMVASFTRFTSEMRQAVALMMDQFNRIYRILERLETNMAQNIYPPIMRFTNALGVDFALPYQACLQWPSIQMIIKAIFEGRPGKPRVDRGMFRITDVKNGRLLWEQNWDHVPVKEGDHIEMSVVFKMQPMGNFLCSFSGCHSSQVHLGDADNRSVCLKCGCSMELGTSPDSKDEVFYSRTTDMSHPDKPKKAQFGEGEDSEGSPLNNSMKDDKRGIDIYRKVALSPILPHEMASGYMASLNGDQVISNLISLRYNLFPEFCREISALIKSLQKMVTILWFLVDILIIYPHKAQIGLSYAGRVASSCHKTVRDILRYNELHLPPRLQWVSMNEDLNGQGGMTLIQRIELFHALWSQVVYKQNE